MTAPSTQRSSLTDSPEKFNCGKEMTKEKEDLPPSHLNRIPSFTTPINPGPLDDDISYPEGGRGGWLVVLGAFCGLTASLGVYNTCGVLSAVIAEQILPEVSPSTLGWIFSVYGFVNWVCGVQVGPTFDAMGPRALILGGTVCTLVGIFTLSVSTGKCRWSARARSHKYKKLMFDLHLLTNAAPEYYQIFLSFSLLTGIGSSLLLTPSMACVAHWFMKRRGLASGIAFIGGGFGGVLFPLMIQALLPKVGWAWSIRIMGFVLLVFCAISIAFCRSRVPPRNGSATTWRDAMPDPKIFIDGSGAMALTTLGVLLTDLAYFIPITYVPSYYIARQGLSSSEAVAGSAAFAYQLLAILNASSCIGRAVAGGISDRWGRYNTMIVSLVLCIISALGLWLADILTGSPNNSILLILFVLLFGFVSGSNVSLTPVCLGQLCETQEYGRYYASCFTVVAFGVLISIPIAGGLLGAVDATGEKKFWATALFTGLSYVGALLCFVWVRIKVKGFSWRTKW